VSDDSLVEAIASCLPGAPGGVEVVFLNCCSSWALCQRLQSTLGIPVVVGWDGTADSSQLNLTMVQLRVATCVARAWCNLLCTSLSQVKRDKLNGSRCSHVPLPPSFPFPLLPNPCPPLCSSCSPSASFTCWRQASLTTTRLRER
jgi:hypothetical protein